MTVDRPNVIKAHIIKDVVREYGVLDIFLEQMQGVIERLDPTDRIPVSLFKVQIGRFHTLLG